MKPDRFPRLLRAACLLSLLALGLMVWSLFDPGPLPIILAMSLGQLLGTLSLGIFLFVVFVDLRPFRGAPPPAGVDAGQDPP